MNLPRSRARLLGQNTPFTPPFQEPSREHELPEIEIKGKGPWTYAMLIAAGLGIWMLASK